jgi:isoleucyl-tRNA synthetase
MRQIETVRATGEVGSSLAAELDVHAAGEDYKMLASLGDDLRFVFIVSRGTLHQGGDGLQIDVHPTKAPKCDRCWHHRDDVGQDPAHPGLCGRCVSNLFGTGEPREHA